MNLCTNCNKLKLQGFFAWKLGKYKDFPRLDNIYPIGSIRWVLLRIFFTLGRGWISMISLSFLGLTDEIGRGLPGIFPA